MEYTDIRSGNEGSVRMEEALAAARRLHVRCVTQGANGAWRPASPWLGSRQATEAADRELRLAQAERSMRSASRTDADRSRRLRLANLSIDPTILRRIRLRGAMSSWLETERRLESGGAR